MKFIKTIFASCLGVLLFSVAMMIILFSMLAGSSSTTEVDDNSVLLVSLDGVVVEKKENNFYDNLMQSGETTNALNDILAAIKNAKDDDKIKGICLKTNAVSAGYATMEEIRSALEDFKTSGKFVYAYSGLYTQGAYYVATAADSLFMNPQGSLNYSGISSSSLFFKDFLKKVGVEFQVVRVGSYKSYAESFVGDSMSAENKEQLDALISAIWNSILEKISADRNIPKEELASLADSLIPLSPAPYVLEKGLVDGLKYKDEFLQVLREKLSLNDNDDVPTISVSDYLLANNLGEEISVPGMNEVAVVYLNGEIDNGSKGGINSTETVRLLSELGKNPDVKAIVLRINSPGGSAYGSEQICHMVENVKKYKPVVASLGDYAASGGYYIASNANEIVSNESTITGSIGVIALIPNAQELSDKLGVHYETVKTNKNADLLENFFRPMSDFERTAMQRSVDDFYHTFVQRCAEGRMLSYEQVDSCAQGRVWSGVDALNRQLVDRYGTLSDAVKEAALLANVSDYQTISYPKKKNILEQLEEIPSLGYEKLKENEVFSKEKIIFGKIRSLDRVQAVLPYTIELR